MMELVEANWVLFLAALLIGIAVAWWIFVATRRTRVTGDRRDVLDEGTESANRNQALIDAPPAVHEPEKTVAEPITVESQIAGNTSGDDLTRIKGLGPKLRDLLATLGVTRFEQIAGWTEEDIDRIDAQLGRFEGRIQRDDWIGQARHLAAGDTAAYEAQFGKL